MCADGDQGRNTKKQERCFRPHYRRPIVPGEAPADVDLFGQRGRNHVADEHGDDGTDDDADDFDQLQLLPAVINDERAHHARRRRWHAHKVQTYVAPGSTSQIE